MSPGPGLRTGIALLLGAAIVALAWRAWPPVGDSLAPATGRPDSTVNLPLPDPAGTAPEPATLTQGTPIPALATTRDLNDFLAARGLPADALIAAYASWRRNRGFLDSDTLAGPAPGGLGSDYYQSLSTATLTGMARAGDLAASLVLAGRLYAQSPARALEEFIRGSHAGSAQGMLAAGEVLGAMPRPESGADPRAAGLAWTLAAVRQHGPAVVEPAVMSRIEQWEAQLAPDELRLACEMSVDLFTEHRARQVPEGELPPVFVMPVSLYNRLPCRDADTAIKPPDALARCEALAADDRDAAPVEVRLCPRY